MRRLILVAAITLTGCSTPDQQTLICSRPPTDEIADDDPALRLFRDEPTSADRKIALAIERTNGCD